MAGGAPTSVGRFAWRVPEDHWWWSEEMFELHGFTAGEIVPSTEVVLAHKHPDDIDQVHATMRSALEAPRAFSCYHRIIDARRRQHTVVTVGESLPGEDAPGDDAPVGLVRGFVVDLTLARRADFHEEVAAAVDGATRHRAAIEQSKGALMLALGLDEAGAFALLRDLSSTSNTKVALLAERLATRLGESRPLGEEARSVLDVLLAASVDGHERCDGPGSTG